MSTIDTARFMNRLLRLVDELEVRSDVGLQRVHDHLRDDPAARECIRVLAHAGKGVKGYVGIVNDVHRRLAGAEARGLNPRLVADAVWLLVEFGANPFVALQDLGPDHALLSSRASSRLICDRLAFNPEGYVNRTDYPDADDLEPNMRGLRRVAIHIGGSSPAQPQELSSQVLPNIMELAGKQALGIEALLRWHRFIEWLRLSQGAISGSAGALAALDERVLGFLIPSAMQGDPRTEAVRRGLAVEEAVRALISAARGEPVSLSEQKIGFASADVLFEPFRAFAFASPSVDGSLAHSLIDPQTLVAAERALASAVDLRLPPADPVGPSLRETQRRLRYLARIASDGQIDQIRVADLLFPVGASSVEREAYRCGFERLSEARINPLLERAGSTEKRVKCLRMMVEMEVDTFSSVLDAADPTGFLDRVVDCAISWDDEESDLATDVFSQEFVARTAGNLRRARSAGGAHDRRLAFFEEREKGFEAADVPIRAAIVDEDVREFRRILVANFHREFDLARIVRDAVTQFGGDPSPDDPCFRHLCSWVTTSVTEGASAGGEIPTFGPLASMSSDELVREAKSRPRELHGIFQVPVAHAICYLAGSGSVAARVALETLSNAELMTHAELRQLWMVQPDMLGRSSGYALSAACSKQALASLTGPTVEQEVRSALQFGLSSTDGVTGMMAAARSAANDCDQRMEGFRWLLGNREALGLGEVDARDHRGWRAIHHAVSCGNTDAAQDLMKSGASVKIESGDATSVLVEAFDCANESRYALAVWFVSGSVLPAIAAGNGGKVPAGLFKFGHDRLDHFGMPRTVANVGMANDHYLRFVQFAVDHPEVWEGLTAEAVNAMFAKDSGIDRFRMVSDLNPQCAAAAVDKHAIFRLLDPLRPHYETGSISSTIDIIDALRRIKALDVDGVDSKQRSVFHALAASVQLLQDVSPVSAREQASLVRALLGANPSAHERAVSRPDFDRRSSVVAATSGGQTLLALLLSRALAARDPGARSSKLQGAARLIHNPGQLAQLVASGGNAMLQLTPSGEVVLAGGGRTFNLGASPQGSLRVEAPLEVRNVVDWLSRQDVQAAIETNIAQAFGQPNYAVTFDDFIAWLDHLGNPR